MEGHPNSLLDSSPFYQAKSTEELTQSLWLATMELHEEIKDKDDQLNQLKDLLNDAIKDRNEAQNKCQWLLRQHFRHSRRQTTPAPRHSGGSSIEDEPSEESIVSSPNPETPVQFLPAPAVSPEQELGFPASQTLPEKGKLLEAVMKAGPLLQNLLLAGPLPTWRHPPPPLDVHRIPAPAVIPTPAPANYLLNQRSLLQINSNPGGFNNKRGFSDDSDSSTETKHQRITLNYQ